MAEPGALRIGLVAPVWGAVPPVGYGGTELVVDVLARGLQALGHEVVLAATADSTCPVEVRSLLPAAEPHRIGELLPELRHVAFAYDQLADCHVVHDHTLAGPLYAGGRPGLPPVVTTCHGALVGETLAWYREISRRIPVLAISRSQASVAPGMTTRVIHHGVVADDYPVGRGDGDHLLFLGRMSPDKGAHRAAEVARRTGRRLLIAAKMREPAERAYFDDVVRPLLGRGVEYVGEVGGAEKLALLGSAAGLLMPIRWREPFGMVMLEALACGTPVLAFKEGAAVEIVESGRTGWLCSDEADMADAVQRLDEIDRAACRRAVEGYFSADRMAREHVEAYRHAIARRAVTPPRRAVAAVR